MSTSLKANVDSDVQLHFYLDSRGNHPSYIQLLVSHPSEAMPLIGGGKMEDDEKIMRIMMENNENNQTENSTDG